MDDFRIRAGDRLPPLECDLINHLGLPAENLAAASAIEFKYRPLAGGATRTRVATLVDAATGRVKYEWIANETDAVNTYVGYFQVTFADGKKESFPNYKFLRIGVVESL